MRFVRIAALTVMASCAVHVGARHDASAQTDDAARAQALFDQGTRAMNAGDLAQACPKLEEAQRIVRGIGVTLRLADCYDKGGRTASAWAQFKAAEAMSKDKQDPRESIASDRAAQLEPHLARVRILVASKVDGLEITEDATAIGRAQWGEALPTDPGEHVLRARAPGFDAFETRFTAKNDAPPLDVSVPSLTKTKVAPQPAAPAREDPSRMTWVAWTGFGVAAAGAALGGVTGVVTLNDAHLIHDKCPQSQSCDPGSLDRVNRLRSDGQTLGAISTVSFIVAGAGALVGVGAVLFHWGGARSAPASAGVFVGPESVWVRGEF